MQETIGEKILPIDENSLVNNVQIDDKATLKNIWKLFKANDKEKFRLPLLLTLSNIEYWLILPAPIPNEEKILT